VRKQSETFLPTISTHVLDTALGKPAEGVRIVLEHGGAVLGVATTDADGRVKELVKRDLDLPAGVYKLTFAVADYFAASGRECFYTDVVVNFRMLADGHYHVPLLASPYGYSTYRGS
jgi:5-hydroxyisourate hydrolase